MSPGVYHFLRVRHCLTLSYTDNMRPTPTVTISLPTPLLVMLDAIADERHMNRSELVRDILRQYLEKDESNFRRY